MNLFLLCREQVNSHTQTVRCGINTCRRYKYLFRAGASNLQNTAQQPELKKKKKKHPLTKSSTNERTYKGKGTHIIIMRLHKSVTYKQSNKVKNEKQAPRSFKSAAISLRDKNRPYQM